LFAATALDATPAGYYGPGGLFDLSGNVKQAPMVKFAFDDRAAMQLFDQLKELARVRTHCRTPHSPRLMTLLSTYRGRETSRSAHLFDIPFTLTVACQADKAEDRLRVCRRRPFVHAA
jgi:hypothetical protein